MTETMPVLYMFCGKIAAGKSTLAAEIKARGGSVVIAEDEWLHGLFGDQMATVADYVRCSGKLRKVIGSHVVDLLQSGTAVILDFPANTVQTRVWMRGLLDQADCPHELHLMVPPDEVCLERLRKRNESGAHPFAVTEEQFHQISKHFEPPTEAEGFTVIVHE